MLKLFGQNLDPGLRDRIASMSNVNLDAVINLLTEFGNGNPDKALANLHPDFTASIPESLPWGGTWKGGDGFMSLIAGIMTHFDVAPAADPVFLEVDATGQVIAHLTTRYTAKETGRSLTFRLVEI